MVGRRILIVLALIAAVVALVHLPPGPQVTTISSCCPRATTTEVMRGAWALGIAKTLINVLLCVALFVSARRGALRVSVVVGAAAAAASLAFASDLVVRLDLVILDVTFDPALVSVTAFVVSVVLYGRRNPKRVSQEPLSSPT